MRLFVWLLLTLRLLLAFENFQAISLGWPVSSQFASWFVIALTRSLLRGVQYACVLVRHWTVCLNGSQLLLYLYSFLGIHSYRSADIRLTTHLLHTPDFPRYHASARRFCAVSSVFSLYISLIYAGHFVMARCYCSSRSVLSSLPSRLAFKENPYRSGNSIGPVNARWKGGRMRSQ